MPLEHCRRDHDARLSGLQNPECVSELWPEDSRANLIEAVPKAITLGGWLGGALQWHFTFMWIFAAGGVLYVISQIASGHYRTVLFTPRDLPGVWPMVRHYFFFGPKPTATGAIQSAAEARVHDRDPPRRTLAADGMVMYKPVQLSALGWLFGGYHGARLMHFLAMCGIFAFIPGHLVMVALHGWDNFASMVTGWKRHPDYVTQDDR